MSQSDYIQYKSLKRELVEQNKLSPVLNSQDYTLFVKYSMESYVSNKKLRYNQLQPPKQLFHPVNLSGGTNVPDVCKKVCPNVQSSILGIGKQLIFNMEQSTVGCPRFIDPAYTDCSNS